MWQHCEHAVARPVFRHIARCFPVPACLVEIGLRWMSLGVRIIWVDER